MLLTDIRVGEALPGLEISLSPTFIISASLASRDFNPVHHDQMIAAKRGLNGIITNIQTTAGLVSRLVTEWCGPRGRISEMSFRLLAPNYAGDTLRLVGKVASKEADHSFVRVAIEGHNAVGKHVVGNVLLDLTDTMEGIRAAPQTSEPMAQALPVAEPDPVRTRFLEWVASQEPVHGEASLPVNVAMIRNWCEALGDRNPIYAVSEGDPDRDARPQFAPPAMLLAWTLPGLRSLKPEETTPLAQLMAQMDDAGFPGVVATDWTQSISRYLSVGDRLHYSSRMTGVSARKETSLGAGYFIVQETDFKDQAGQTVGHIVMRVLKYAPSLQARVSDRGIRGLGAL